MLMIHRFASQVVFCNALALPALVVVFGVAACLYWEERFLLPLRSVSSPLCRRLLLRRFVASRPWRRPVPVPWLLWQVPCRLPLSPGALELGSVAVRLQLLLLPDQMLAGCPRSRQRVPPPECCWVRELSSSVPLMALLFVVLWVSCCVVVVRLGLVWVDVWVVVWVVVVLGTAVLVPLL